MQLSIYSGRYIDYRFRFACGAPFLTRSPLPNVNIRHVKERLHTFDIKDVKKRINTLIFHIGALQGSYPKVLTDPEYSAAHLILLREILPTSVHVLKFSADMVPVVNQMLSLVCSSSSGQSNASNNLRTINSAAEMAVTEILTALDEMDTTLQEIREIAAAGESIEEAIDDLSMRLTTITSALQFQDITSQQIEATHALPANLGQGLQQLIEKLGVSIEGPQIAVKEGPYDTNARYDRQAAQERQQEIDEIIEEEPEAAAEEEPEQAAAAGPAEEMEAEMEEEQSLFAEGEEVPSETEDEAVDQDDIDSLIEKSSR